MPNSSLLALLSPVAMLSIAPPALAQETVAPAPEVAALATRTGSWSVTDTFRITPEAAPAVSSGLVAGRRMVGSYLEETLHDPGGSKPLRIDYLGYDATAGQWNYVSVEGRIPVALMKATSFGRDRPERVTVRFDPFAAPPISPAWNGRLLRMEEIVTQDSPDHETKEQYFSLADGTGTPWLAHLYDYRRRR